MEPSRDLPPGRYLSTLTIELSRDFPPARSSGDVTFEDNRARPTSNVDYWKYWDKKQEDEELADKDKKKEEITFKVLDIDLKKLNNKFDHQTFRYEHDNLVIRRGHAFTVMVKVDKKFNRGEDVIKLQFVTGISPRESTNTMFLITPGKAVDPTKASAVLEYVTDEDDGSSTLRLSVCLPCDAPVGRFTMCVRVKSASGKKYVKHKLDEKIVVLFNPWCKEDAVFMPNEDERKEYVLNQSGQIWVGSSRKHGGKSWVFGQFDQASLDAALMILDSSSLPFEAYGNPVRVARCLSAMVNSNDHDKGILTGNWSGDYTGGTPPTQWVGSVKILEEFVKTKKQVKYGQCWVFSGVMTTVCRALGIPARSVTNFDSAHDRDLSMTLDYHVDETGEPIRHMNDSIWNFHVWNEAWFQRFDLPDGNDGWQAVDATPQELSDGVMQCGPAPVAAIKAGNVHLGYDTKFVFAEVNGDCVTWLVNAQEEREVLDVDPDKVGAKISTKAVGKRERLDLTNEYKYKEGSADERRIARTVSQMSSRRKGLQAFYKCQERQDVKMTFEGVLNEKADANFIFKAVNNSKEERTVCAKITLVAQYYTGVDGETIAKESKDLKLSPSTEDVFEYSLKAKDWLNKCAEDATIGVYVYGKVHETGQKYIYKGFYEVDKPSLQMEIQSHKTKLREPFDLTISFTNPLEIALTNNSFMVEGAGLTTEREVVLPGSIGPGEKISKTVTVTPKMTGEREVISSFHSRQLTGIFGSVDIQVEE